MAKHIVVPETRPNGPAAAALLAGGIGAAALGVTTTLAAASTKVADAFKWSAPVGPLSGEAGVTLILYFISWGILHLIFHNKTTSFGWVTALSLILLAAGLLGTFPPFFQLFIR